MGNSPPVFDPAEEKKKLEINCFKIKGYLEIYRDRKLNDARAKEKALLKEIMNPTRSRQDEIEKARIIITALNYVKACDILIRYSEIVRNNSLIIIENRKEHQKIIDLIPYIESIIWAVKYMGIDNLVEFQNYILFLFGNDFQEAIEKSQRIDPDLKACFENLIPTPNDVNAFYVDLSYRTNVPLEKINEVGHEFARTGSPPPPPHSGGGGGMPYNPNNQGQNAFQNGFGQNQNNGLNPNPNGYPGNNNTGFGNQAPPQGNGSQSNENQANNKIDFSHLDDFEKRLRDLKG